jgi:ATP-binding cassette, subfamily B, multidrug efflux pump
MKALRDLNPYIWKYKWRLFLGVVFIVFTNLFAVYAPSLIGEGVDALNQVNKNYFEPISDAELENPGLNKDDLVENASIDLPPSLDFLSGTFNMQPDRTTGINTYEGLVDTIATIALLLAVLYLVTYFIKGIFLFMTRQTIIVMSRLIEYDLKNTVYDHYQKLNVAFYKRNNTGDLMNRISEDVSKVRMYLGPAIMYTLNLAVMLVLVIGVMFSIDPELTFWALFPLPFMSVCIYLVSSVINKRSEAVQKQQSNLSTMVQESISGIRVLKAYHREDYSRKNFTRESDAYKMKSLDLVKIDALFMPIIVLLVGLSTILTIYVGGLKVNSGELQLGDVFNFVFYVNLLTWPFASVGWVTSLVQKAEASMKRINEFLQTEPEIQNLQSEPTEIQGDIEFKNISFTYPDSGIVALDNISFKLKKGETLAVIGRTGSGKSTLASLISRNYDATKGEILVDGQPIKDVNLYDLREAIGFVPQEVFLFSDSIKNNIAFGLSEANDDLVKQAAMDADVHDNIVEFPKGYDTLLGERGINLSGGQKQRISIARAIVKKPQILIFDDCLSAVDTETEETILKNLKHIMKDRTSLIVSHRVSSIKHADHILVMDEGRIVEEGDHKSLMDSRGVYSELYQKQLLEEQTA